MKICFGLASGIGNAAFTIPTLKALHLMGHEVTAYVGGDYAMTALFQRCRYLSAVVDANHLPPPRAQLYVAGHWCPPAMRRLPGLKHYRFTAEPHYPEPEWSLAFQAARDLGWQVDKPDVSDWCRGLRREIKFDVGFVPGCKPGDVWERKRWPGLADVSEQLSDLRCAVIGQPVDDDPAIVGERVMGTALHELPEALASCRVIVGTDSGPLHLASSLGVPVVGVFTATSTVKGEPVGSHSIITREDLSCRPCQSTPVWHACHRWVCRDIEPQRVVNAALGMLGGGDEGVSRKRGGGAGRQGDHVPDNAGDGPCNIDRRSVQRSHS